jgi:translocation and assembly module TamB
MKPRRNRLLRVLRWLSLLLICLIVLILLLPLWFPLVLSPVLKSAGLRYQRYERIGFSRLLVHDVTGQWNQTTLHSKEIECVLPTTWVLEKYIRGTNAAEQLIVRDGVLTIGTSTNTSASAKQGSSGKTFDLVEQIAATLRRFLPKGKLTNCVIEAAGNRVTIPTAEWKKGTLRGNIRALKFTNEITATINTGTNFLAVNALTQLQRTNSESGVPVELSATFRRDAERWIGEGHVLWMTNRFELSAKLTTNGWWPEVARLDAPRITLPATLVGARDYQDLHAALTVDITSNRFDLQATGFALPQATMTNFPQVEISLRARGDSDLAKLEQLHITTPWLRAELTNTIGITRSGDLLNNRAQLQVALNFEQFPGSKIRGGAEGAVIVQTEDRQHPSAKIALTGTNIQTGPLRLRTATLQGEFASPVLTISEFSAALADDSKFDAHGSINVLSNKVENAEWHLSGHVLQQFVTNLTYSRFEASGQISGTFTNLSHQGEVAIENPVLGDFKLARAQIDWRGENLNFASARIEAASSEATLLLDGQVNCSAVDQRVLAGMINSATLKRTNQALLQLQQPFTFAFDDADTNALKIELGASEWRGGEREVSFAANVNWPSQGNVRLSAKNISSRDFPKLDQQDRGTITLTSLSHHAEWTNGPVHSETSVTATFQDESSGKVEVTGVVRSGEFLEITNFRAISELAPPLTIEGQIPIQIIPGRTNSWFVADENRLVNLHADWQADNQDFSIPLGPLGKLRLSQPVLHAHASGIFDEVTAAVTIGVASVDVQSTATNLLSRTRIDNLRVAGDVARGSLSVREFSAEVDGQTIRASGECKLEPKFWERLISERQPPDWRQAKGRLEIPKANVAALSRYMPAVLAPEGQVSLDISLAEGGEFSGVFLLTNAATRPFGEFTPLRDISTRIKLKGSEATLESFYGEIGGQPLRATGRVLIPLEAPLEYQVNLQGTNIPLARDLEFLLRGDINVELRGGVTNTTLSGSVDLHDGLFVQHATALFESGPKRPELRPPYFSITNEPFANWKLGLLVRGNRFLRVQAPVFNGSLSANLAVKGTLREPVVSGDMRVDEGRIIFPFGALRIERGFANVTGNDPRGPDILLNASGRNFDYDIHLEAKGPADGAKITFSSTPPLNSDEILLMLTAGQLPANRYTFSTTSKAGRLATFLGSDIWNRYSGGGATENRLTISTGENISQEGKLTYSVEYKLTDRWSVIGEYDRFNAVNAELKWKIISR